MQLYIYIFIWIKM